MTKRIAILGAGSWGTAVALHLAHFGNHVLLWGHNPTHVQLMQQQRENNQYLPGFTFPETLLLSDNLHACSATAEFVIIATPSHAFADVLSQMAKPSNGLIWLTKGLDPATHSFLSSLVAKRWGNDYPVAIITGPSFASEVAQFLPTAVTLASNNAHFQQQIQQVLHQDNLRVYLSSDLIGVQICGAVKNILAIACGISDGLGYGANAKSALITRGLAEMRRLGQALNAREDTFLGLAGLGDLVLTCTDNKSRNRRFGLLLGEGSGIKAAEQQIHQVVEGKYNAVQIWQLATDLGVEMPICSQVKQLLDGAITPHQAVKNLMTRAVGEE